MDIQEIATGLRFPEGPIACVDGSIILVEIEAGRLTRIDGHRARNRSLQRPAAVQTALRSVPTGVSTSATTAACGLSRKTTCCFRRR